MSKIIRLEATNVKRLRAVTITPQGNVVVIGGDNAQGKTSVLDSIAMAIGGGDERPSMPVRKGEEKARIVLETEDFVITRTFTAAGGTALVVTDRENGFKASSPQALLDKLSGKLAFDPLAFIRLDAKKQAEQLRHVVGVDTRELEAYRAKIYDERTQINRDVKRLDFSASELSYYPDAPAEEVDPVEIVKAIDAVRGHNSQRVTLESTAEAGAQRLQDARECQKHTADRVTELKRQLREACEELEEYDKTIPKLVKQAETAQAAVAAFVDKSETELQERLTNAKSTNSKVAANRQRDAAVRATQEAKTKSEALTSQIAEIDTQKAEALAHAKFPVPGLSFADQGITYNDVPFEQASSAEQLRVSVAMAASLNPKLRVMMVRDASLLDAKSRELLASLAAEHDLQLWLEVVGKDESCSLIIEDGMVVGSDKEPATFS